MGAEEAVAHYRSWRVAAPLAEYEYQTRPKQGIRSTLPRTFGGSLSDGSQGISRNWSLRSREDRIACNGSSRVGMARGRATSFPGYPNCRKGAGVSAGKEPEVSGSSIVRPLLGAAKLDEVSAEARRFAEETGRYPAGTSRNGEVRGLIKRAISAVRNELPQQANPPATPLVFENPPCGGEQNPVRPRLGPLQHAKGCDAWVVATC